MRRLVALFSVCPRTIAIDQHHCADASSFLGSSGYHGNQQLGKRRLSLAVGWVVKLRSRTSDDDPRGLHAIMIDPCLVLLNGLDRFGILTIVIDR